MFGRISNLLLSGCAASATAVLGLSFAGHAGAQPYYDQPSYERDYDGSRVGEVIVTPDYRSNRSENGIPTQRVYASRVVHFDDLDLSTSWGVHRLHSRVVRAATDACDELDRLWPQGLYPIDSSDGDCKARAIRHAMAQAPIGEAADADYNGR
jgi:UrcA family protein